MFLGIDIGGTTGRVSAYRVGWEPSSLLDSLEFSVTKQPKGDFEQDYANLAEACFQLGVRYGSARSAGLAVAGKINADRTQMTGAGNLGHWAGIPLAEMLARDLKCHVVLGNDVEAAALAEAHYGRGAGRNFWFIGWGTGIGGCQVRTSKNGPLALPGEFGHQQVGSGTMPICGCGQYGCLEAYCGGTGIANWFGVPAERLSRSEWLQVVNKMAVGIHNVLAAQPTPLVVFGGGIANKQQWLLEALRDRLARNLKIVDVPDITMSAFGESAGTVGALSLLHLE